MSDNLTDRIVKKMKSRKSSKLPSDSEQVSDIAMKNDNDVRSENKSTVEVSSVDIYNCQSIFDVVEFLNKSDLHIKVKFNYQVCF